MASEREELVFGLRYDGQGQVADLANDLGRVERIVAELSRSMQSGGFTGASAGLLRELASTVRQEFSALEEARAGLLIANQKATDVQRKIALTAAAGGPGAAARKAGGFASEGDQIIAEGSAVRAQSAAARALDREFTRATSALTQAVSADEARARVGRIVARNLSEEATAGTKAAATTTETAGLEKRLQRAIQDRLTANEREAASAEKQAELTSRLQSVDAELAARKPAPYASPDITTDVGRAQSSVNAAEIQLDLASRKLTDERNSTSRTYESVRRAEQAVESADQRLAAARHQLSNIETRSGGSLTQQFVQGFKGVSDRPYVEQIGQAFKFSVLYGTAYKVLFALTQTFQQSLQEGIAFQQAMTELSVASGRPTDELNALADKLGQASAAAGFAPSQGVLVGARSLGLFGQAAGSGATAAQQEQTQLISARVISQIAQGSGLQPADIQSNISAIANAYGQGAQGLIRAQDLDAYLTRKFGVAPGSTLAPVSEAATVGQAAGFSQEQITSIAADLMARTGTTPEAVAGYMAQIFSRSGEGALNTINQRYGIDSQAPLAQQFAELAKVYARQPDARDEISAAFGRGKVQNAVIALLSDYATVQHQAAQAGRPGPEGATGQGAIQFGLRMANVGGEISKLVGSLREFASLLGQTGLLTDVGALIVAFRHIVDAANSILRTWDRVPGVTRQVIGALVGLAAAAKIAQAADLGGILRGGGGAHAAETGIFGTNVSRLGGFAVATAVLSDVLLWSSLRDATSKLTDAQSNTAKLLNQETVPNATSAQLHAQAAGLASAATQDREATHGVLHSLGLVGGQYGIGPSDAAVTAQANQADAEARRLDRLAQLQAAADANRSARTSPITGFDSTSLSASMQAITDSGGTARDQLEALNRTLRGTADAAQRANFNPTLFAGDNARNLINAISGSSYVDQSHVTGVNWNPLTDFRHPLNYTHTNAYDDAVRQALSGTEAQNRAQQALSSISSPTQIKGSTATSIARYIVADTPEKALANLGITDPKQIAIARQHAIDAVRKELLAEAKAARELIDPKHKLSSTELTAVINQQVSSTQDLLNSLPQNDLSGRIRVQEQLVRQIQAAIARSQDGATDQATQQLDAARRALAEAQISRLEAMRRAAQHMAKTDAEVKSIGRSFFNRELAKAIQGGDTDALVGLINNAGNWSIAIARKAITDAIAVIRAAVSTEAQVQAFQASEIAGIQGMIHQPGATGGGPNAKQGHRLDQLNAMLGALQDALPQGQGNVYDTGSDANRPPKSTPPTPGPTAAQIAAARQSALAAGSESGIAQARAAMASAQADMAAAKKGTVEYYQALGAYLQARNQLSDAIVAYHQNLFLLHHDATNPIVQARAAVVAAAAALRADAGKPGDVIAADRVALQSAQAQVEQTKFQQRLDAAQTAEQLGRISFRAYINYLDHERDRLEKIKHRSYQQQQELNNVDQLLQQASQSMQGIFNFGDIKLPAPYQVRRYIEEHFGGGSGQSRGVGFPGAGATYATTNNLNFNGVDHGEIRRIVREILGANTDNQTTRPRRR